MRPETPPRRGIAPPLGPAGTGRGGGIILLCDLSRDPLWHAHELTRQQLLGRFEPEPVADPAMHLRQRHATPVRPRGKSPAGGVPAGLAPASAATRARPGSCTPASR